MRTFESSGDSNSVYYPPKFEVYGMAGRDIRTIWITLAAFLFVYSANAWSASQGGPSIGSALLIDPQPIAARYWASVVIGPLLFALGIVGFAYARRVLRHERGCHAHLYCFPLAGLAAATRRPNSLLLHAHLIVTLFAFFIIPMLAMELFRSKAETDGRLFDKDMAQCDYRLAIHSGMQSPKETALPAPECGDYRVSTVNALTEDASEKELLDFVIERKLSVKQGFDAWRNLETQRAGLGITPAKVDSRLHLAQSELSIARWMKKCAPHGCEPGEGTELSGPHWLTASPYIQSVSYAMAVSGILIGLASPFALWGADPKRHAASKRRARRRNANALTAAQKKAN